MLKHFCGRDDFLPGELSFFWVAALYHNNADDSRNKGVAVDVNVPINSFDDLKGLMFDLGTVDLTPGP